MHNKQFNNKHYYQISSGYELTGCVGDSTLLSTGTRVLVAGRPTGNGDDNE